MSDWTFTLSIDHGDWAMWSYSDITPRLFHYDISPHTLSYFPSLWCVFDSFWWIILRKPCTFFHWPTWSITEEWFRVFNTISYISFKESTLIFCYILTFLYGWLIVKSLGLNSFVVASFHPTAPNCSFPVFFNLSICLHMYLVKNFRTLSCFLFSFLVFIDIPIGLTCKMSFLDCTLSALTIRD